MRTAIIGGGVAGMAAAYELEKARKTGAQVEYTLFETRERLGGCLSSEVADGLILERGPDSFLSEKPAAAELCRELGLAADLMPSNDAERKTYILVRNRLVPLPDGLMFLIPTKLVPTALTRLFSLPTKARMALELLHPPRPSGLADESVAALVERHFGAEAVDRLADPLLSGIYGGDSRQLSARAVLPKLVEMESEYGSLTRGMLAAHGKMRARAAAAKNGNSNGRPAVRSIFTTLRGGLQQMIDALAAQLDPAAVRLCTTVNSLERTDRGWLVNVGGVAEPYDAVIMASPAWAAGALLGGVDPVLGEALGGIPYSSSITVNLVYDESQLGPLPDGFGFLVPASEGRSMLACTFVHRKFLGRTPQGKAVLRAFLGGANGEARLAESDETLLATIRRELSEILGKNVLRAETQPERTQVTRWRRAMAQYSVGYGERKRRIAEHVAGLPGLRLAGNAYDGIGIPDCIRLGRLAARELLTTVSERS